MILLVYNKTLTSFTLSTTIVMGAHRPATTYITCIIPQMVVMSPR